MIETMVHIAILLILPPFLLSVINKTKAWFGGRLGPPLLQPYFDLIKLMRKGFVVSRTTTWVFLACPVVVFTTVFLAGLMIPMGQSQSPISFQGDLIVFAYLFGLARFFMTVAALDTGSPFEGMGASREVTFASLTEPALFFILLVLAKISSSLTLTDMLLVSQQRYSAEVMAPLALAAIGLFIVLLAENCRIPIDDPNTHLELTMIHEAMVLDHSGPLFGVILYASTLKLFVISTVLLQVIMPFHTHLPWIDWPLFVLEIMGVSAAIGIVESTMARLQMRHTPYLLIAVTLFCGFGFLLLVR